MRCGTVIPGKLKTVISGHLGWVRSLAVEPGNQWFATGAGDRVIKVRGNCTRERLLLTPDAGQIWDLASGELKLSLTGHISTVRGLAVSPRHPYLFSCAEDKVRRWRRILCARAALIRLDAQRQMVKCWDLEVNKVIRHYHGHLSGVYSLEWVA